MYKRFKLINKGCASGEFSPFVTRQSIARPMSYYLNGGVDLDGVSTRKPLESHFDSSEDISLESVDIASDPTVGKLDLAEAAFSYASDTMSKRSLDNFVPTPKGESDSD